MKPEVLAFFYGGPDQIMPLQTGLAAALAFLLLFWNKARLLLVRAWDWFRSGRHDDVVCESRQQPPAGPLE